MKTIIYEPTSQICQINYAGQDTSFTLILFRLTEDCSIVQNTDF